MAGLLILQALEGDLEWIRVADPEAERVDDIQLGTPGRVDGVQVKWDRTPKTVSWAWLLNPSKTKPSLARQLADGWKNVNTPEEVRAEEARLAPAPQRTGE